MPFQNPVLAGEYLIRPGMRSVNYVPGESGWRVSRDGSAEFHDITARGHIEGSTIEGGVITGATIRTAEPGNRRLVLSGSGHSLEAYNAADERVGELDSFFDRIESFRLNSNANADGRTGIVDATPEGVDLWHAGTNDPSATKRAHLNLQSTFSSFLHVYDPEHGLMADELYFLANPFGRVQLYGNGTGSSLVLRNGNVYCSDLNENANPIYASDFVTASSRDLKTNIDSPRFNALDMVRSAPTRIWEYASDYDPTPTPINGVIPGASRPPQTRIGPMAEDLPSMATTNDNGVRINAMVGLLWQAVQELAGKLDAR